MSSRGGSGDLLVGFLMGAVGGFLAAMALAPQSGGRTRDQVAEQMGDLRSRTQEVLDKVRGNTEEVLDQVRVSLEGKLSTIQGALEEAYEAGRKAAAYKREELIEAEPGAHQG
ncbi:MAG: YtxH domain-containing protein [Candidatus Sericytochromatia bacterium]|nr:YtxH domain-containing protein [Candidatus Tanganyikabacteria bacterium]